MHRFMKSVPSGLRFCLLRRIAYKHQENNLQFAKAILPVLQGSFLEIPIIQQSKGFSSSSKDVLKNLESVVEYEKVSDKTMESLLDRFEEVLQDSDLKDWDVNYSNGVLTIIIEDNYTYVINKQTPNRQIWLSSPLSEPKRFDFINGFWIYKHNGVSLHELLTEEMTNKLKRKADFSNCSYGK